LPGFLPYPSVGGYHGGSALRLYPAPDRLLRERLIVHYKNLPASTPLFSLMYHQDRLDRRNTGNNASRSDGAAASAPAGQKAVRPSHFPARRAGRT
ncbi:hypothetical protein FK513_28815, partial [Klebsiella pneumoniae]|nr:hypothetical protein [Klebsiella pneumoniae]